MNRTRRVSALTAGVLITFASWGRPSLAVTFGQAKVNQAKLIAIAVPRASGYYSLLVLEQISKTKQCWREIGSKPTRVEPLLVNFNFAGICGRSTDSNGYSLRIADQDLGMTYRLSLQKRGGDLVLLGMPSSGGSSIEVGHTGGIRSGFLKILLAPSWQFSKRTYGDKTLGHIYFSRSVFPPSKTRPTIAQVPPAPSTKTKATAELKPSNPAAVRTSAISSSKPNARPSALSARSDAPYLVAVIAPNRDLQAKVRSKITSAFRSSYGGKTVMQVGLFSDRAKAESVRADLKRQGFNTLLTQKSASQATSTSLPQFPASEVASNSQSGSSALTVPSANVPIGRVRSPRGVYSAKNNALKTLPPPPPQSPVALQYRVFVPVHNEREQTKIRALVPGAFQSRYQGKSMMQVGAFSRAEQADPVINLLQQNGFSPIKDQT